VAQPMSAFASSALLRKAMPKAFLSIGSNIDPDRYIPAALKDLELSFGPLEISSIFESEAEGFEGPVFHNLIVAFESDLPAETIAERLRIIEERHGRTRDSQKFSSRTLDIDLILWGNAQISEGRLLIPRPEITRYAFVLEPLAEIAPDLPHPVSGKTFAELWANFDRSQARQRKLAAPSS
jgi:2-amino-4-hydroxy-6-hydroxymethyldihydropteridine diphosphokinase